MKFNKKLISEGLNSLGTGKKVFTEGKKQNVILSEEQLDRLLLQLKESREKSVELIIRESHDLIRKAIKNERLDLSVDDYSKTITEQGMYDRNPGVAAAEGLENVLNGIKKAYDMIKDSDTRKKLANSITKLGNFMTYTAELVGSGSSQRAPRTYDQVAKPLPHPEFEGSEDSEVDDEMEEQTTAASSGAFVAPLEFTEDSEGEETYNYGEDEGRDDKELYDLKHGGGSEDHIHHLEDDMDYDEDHEDRDEEHTQFESARKRTNLIREDIKKMKQIIRPIIKNKTKI